MVEEAVDQRTIVDGLNLGDTEGWVNFHGTWEPQPLNDLRCHLLPQRLASGGVPQGLTHLLVRGRCAVAVEGDSSVSHRMTLRGSQSEHEVPVVRDRRLVILPGQRDEAEVRGKSRVPPKGSSPETNAGAS